MPCVGWLTIYDLALGWSRERFRGYELLRFAVYVAAFAGLAIYTMLSIFAFYH